jgi:uncharacterized protein YndB with AHSA1/START domain
VKIVNGIEINASPEKVFYWLEKPERARRWMTSVTKDKIVNETPNKVGTTFREYIEEDGRGIEMQGVITEFVSNKRFAVHLESKINSVDVCFDLEEKGSMTQLTQNVILRFKGMMKVLSVFLRSSIKKKIKNQAESELAQLKELCEQPH